MIKKRYVHTESGHNLIAPKEIVPIIADIVKPENVVDVGCGLGTFLYCFKQQGIKEVLGIDGAWVNKSLLYKNIKSNEFIEADLEKPFNLAKRFDLAICLEVVEHLKEEVSDDIVQNLVSLSNIILFSAAIPNQGGQNHINEQWPQYWEEKFKKHGYIFHDVLRQIFWHNEKIDSFYKQNCFLVAKYDYVLDSDMIDKYKSSKVINLVHPDLFLKMHKRTPGGFMQSLANKLWNKK